MLSSNKKPQKQNVFHLKCRRNCQREVDVESGKCVGQTPASGQWRLAEATPRCSITDQCCPSAGRAKPVSTSERQSGACAIRAGWMAQGWTNQKRQVAGIMVG